MCGIVGYIGTNKATDVILSGLEKLEYRGYDSCGIFFFDESNQRYITYKDKGRVAHLINDFDYSSMNHLAIGHTRWATHGKPNQENSHPHFSLSKRFGLVHNGVIENYRELIATYLEGVNFTSETDTEVIVNLIDHFAQSLSPQEAIRKTLSLIEGSYALLIVDTTNPRKFYAAKSKSPLLLGIGKNGVAVASDVMALVGYADQYIPLEDKSFVEICQKETGYEYAVMDIIGTKISYELLEMNFVLEDIGKSGYSHYMLKEICEQPSVIRKIMTRYFQNGYIKLDPDINELFMLADRIYIIAAGTSYHAGFVGKYYFEHLSKIPTEVFIASEFAYNEPLISGDNPLFIFISQSGETADLRACLVKIKQRKLKSLTITNVPSSTLAREADKYIEILAGPEIAVASTKAYVGQVAILLLLAYTSCKHKPFDLKYELSKLAVAMDAIIDKREFIDKIVTDKMTKRNCFYIGRGIDYYTCLEAALKLKEISYIQTEGFAAGELKHGTIALIEDGVPVIAIVSQHQTNQNTRANIHEVEARGAEVLVISTEDVATPSDDIILMSVNDYLTPMLTVIPTQLIAFYSALNLGRHIDKPRNLA
ncbi:MAG: glutamine--fructose-6-phosphate transaminase (isomerizing), partial [Candidatus Izemoplasmatales bacterium]|nr:glutamine--fructose-6-phosphate transaminase (isomerizing) [Candidatus Izemoplasmatales bacterium]